MTFGGFPNVTAAAKPLTGGAFGFGSTAAPTASATVNPFSINQTPAANSTATSSLLFNNSAAGAPLGLYLI